MKQSSKNKRHKKKLREAQFEAIEKLTGVDRDQAIFALAPKMREIFERWRSGR
jgi:hypothetical protein